MRSGLRCPHPSILFIIIITYYYYYDGTASKYGMRVGKARLCVCAGFMLMGGVWKNIVEITAFDKIVQGILFKQGL